MDLFWKDVFACVLSAYLIIYIFKYTNYTYFRPCVFIPIWIQYRKYIPVEHICKSAIILHVFYKLYKKSFAF